MFQLQNLTADQNGTEVGCTTNGYVSDFLPILILSKFNTHISFVIITGEDSKLFNFSSILKTNDKTYINVVL